MTNGKMLTYRYPRTMAEAAMRYPCAGDDAKAIHGPYTGSHEPDRIVLRFCYATIAALLLMVWKGWV